MVRVVVRVVYHFWGALFGSIYSLTIEVEF